MQNKPLSGHVNIVPPNADVPGGFAPKGTDEGGRDMQESNELLDFLRNIDEKEPEEIITFADRFTSTERHLKSSSRAPEGRDEEADRSFSEKGALSAEAILATSVNSPTGTQLISTLDLTAGTIESFAPLRELRISESHKRLARFVPQLQEMYGRKNSWSAEQAQEFNGHYALLDPMMLASYVPYVTEIMDLREEQVIECFHPLRDVDGYPCVHGVPIWERQEWERIEYYNLFKLYRDMRYAFYNESDALITTRSLSTLAKAVRLSPAIVHYLSVVYHWPLRVALYDVWMNALQAHRIAVKRSLMLDRHSKISQSLISKAFTCLNKQVEKMSPKDALEMLKLGIAYERISAGLIGDKPEDGKSGGNQGPLLSIVTQNNHTTGPMQVNNTSESLPQQQLQENMKKPDTLLGILSVLQRSGAFATSVQKEIAESAPIEVEVSEDE